MGHTGEDQIPYILEDRFKSLAVCGGMAGKEALICPGLDRDNTGIDSTFS